MHELLINEIEIFCKDYFGGECESYYDPLTEFYHFTIRNDGIGLFRTFMHKNTFYDTSFTVILSRLCEEYNGWLNYMWRDKEEEWTELK